MAGLFLGKSALRFLYREVVVSNLAGTGAPTNPAAFVPNPNAAPMAASNYPGNVIPPEASLGLALPIPAPRATPGPYPWFRYNKECRIMLFNNSMNVDLSVGVSYPYDANDNAQGQTVPPPPNPILFLFEIGATSVLNFDISGSLGLAVEAGTQFYVWQSGEGTPTAGTKMRMIAWS